MFGEGRSGFVDSRGKCGFAKTGGGYNPLDPGWAAAVVPPSPHYETRRTMHMATSTKMVPATSCGPLSIARFRMVGTMIAALLAVDARAAISLSSQDTFAATNEGWQIGGAGMQPTQVSQPGPDGQTGYLSHLSDGSTSNGKWLMWNDGARWQGNYPSAGVTGISLTANVSAGSSPVSMRIAFDGPGGWFYSSPLSVGSGWSAYSFPLTQSGFSHVATGGGTGSFTVHSGGGPQCP